MVRLRLSLQAVHAYGSGSQGRRDVRLVVEAFRVALQAQYTVGIPYGPPGTALVGLDAL